MTHLVADDGAQLALVEDAQDAGGCSDDGVVRVAARRKGVGRLVVNNEDLGHGHLGKPGDFLDDAVKLRRLLLRDLMRAGHAQRQFVREEVRDEVHDAGEDQRDERHARTAQHVAHTDQQAGQARQK